MEMHTTPQVQDDQALIEAMLASMQANPEVEVEAAATSVDTEIIEPLIELDGVDEIDALLDAAQSQLDNQDAYALQDAALDTNQPEGDKPKAAEEVSKRKVKGAKEPKAAKVAKAPKEAKAPKAPKEPKPAVEAVARVTFHGNRKSAVLDNRLGGRTAEFLVLENADAALTAEDLAVKQAALIEELDTKVAKKVSEKAIMLLKDLAAGGKIGNEVMARAFATLVRDGYLSSGDKGNMQIALRDKYSIGTARSQANQCFSLFPFLKICIKDAKGHMIPNPDSTILASVMAAHDLKFETA